MSAALRIPHRVRNRWTEGVFTVAAVPRRVTLPWPALGPDEARELDRAAEEDYHVPLAIMIENAGRSFAAFARRVAVDAPRRALVLVGKGGNGAGALAAARHLQNAGWAVEIALAAPPETLVAGGWLELKMVETAGARFVEADDAAFARAGVVVDGLLGFNARGEPRPPMDDMIRRANAVPGVRLALDVPTGVDPATGEVPDVAFRAAATLMLAIPKRGTVTGRGPEHAGDLWLGDVGLPEAAYRKLGVARPAFDEAGLTRLAARPRDADAARAAGSA